VSWRGDASPSYLWCPQAPARIAAVAPDARIIVILRDPVERAYAQYLMDYAEGAIHRPFFEAVRTDWERHDKGWGVSQLYVELGLYTKQIQRYRATFGRDRVLVLLLEDLKKDARAVLGGVARFLGIAESPMASIDTTEAHNHYLQPKGQWVRRLAGHPISRFLGERVIPRSMGVYVWEHWMQKEATKPPMDARAAEFLQRLYTKDLIALESELGRPLPELRRTWIDVKESGPTSRAQTPSSVSTECEAANTMACATITQAEREFMQE
ncbi:MAG: sulfotransferase family protein, partial [Acidiferrobacter sp.]